jgi:hypothetical protein
MIMEELKMISHEVHHLPSVWHEDPRRKAKEWKELRTIKGRKTVEKVTIKPNANS